MVPHLLMMFGLDLMFCLAFPMFIFGPQYEAGRKAVHQLINIILGTANLTIWKTRKNKVSGQGWKEGCPPAHKLGSGFNLDFMS